MLSFAPFDGAVSAATTIISALTVTAAPLAGANAAALAIVGLTIAVRLALTPLSAIRARGDRRRQALQPRLQELQRQHRDDPQRLQAEVMKLYRAERVNPFGGCLPGLLQAPVFLVMYRLAVGPPAGSELLTGSLFGVPLMHQLADGLAGPAVLVFAGLFLLLGLLAWRLSRQMRRTAKSASPPPVPAMGSARLLPLLPYGILLVAAWVPVAAGIYLATTTAWTVLEQAVYGRMRHRQPRKRP